MEVDPGMVILVQPVLPPSGSCLRCLQGSYVLGGLHRAGLKLDSGLYGLVLDYPSLPLIVRGCTISKGSGSAAAAISTAQEF